MARIPVHCSCFEFFTHQFLYISACVQLYTTLRKESFHYFHNIPQMNSIALFPPRKIPYYGRTIVDNDNKQQHHRTISHLTPLNRPPISVNHLLIFSFKPIDQVRESIKEALMSCSLALPATAPCSLKIPSTTLISVLVVSIPQKAAQSLATSPAPITSLPLLTVPATRGTCSREDNSSRSSTVVLG